MASPGGIYLEIANFEKFDEGLQDLEQSVKRLGTVVKDFNEEMTKFDNVFKIDFDAEKLRKSFDALSNISIKEIDSDVVKNFRKLTVIFDFFDKVEKLNLTTDIGAKIKTVVDGIVAPIIGLTDAIPNISRFTTVSKSLSDLVQSFNNSSDLLGTLQRTLPTQNISVGSIAKFFVLQTAIKTLAKSLSAFDLIQKPQSITVAMEFLKLLPDLFDILNSLNLSTIAVAPFQTLRSLLPTITAIAVSLAPLRLISTLDASFITSLKSLLESIVDLTESLSHVTFKQASLSSLKNVVVIAPILKTLSMALKPLSNLQLAHISGVGVFLSELMRFLFSLEKLFNELPGGNQFSKLKRLYTQVLAIIPIMVGLGAGLRSFNSIKILDNDKFDSLSQGVKRLVTSATNIQQITRLGAFSSLGIGRKISQIFSALGVGIEAFVKSTRNVKVSQDLTKLTSTIATIVTQLKEINAAEIQNKLERIVKSLSIDSSLLRGFSNEIGNAIRDAFVGLSSTMKKIGIDFAFSFISGVKDELGIASPSKEFIRIANFLIDGLNKGLRVGTHSLYASVDYVVKKGIAAPFKKETQQLPSELFGVFKGIGSKLKDVFGKNIRDAFTEIKQHKYATVLGIGIGAALLTGLAAKITASAIRKIISVPFTLATSTIKGTFTNLSGVFNNLRSIFNTTASYAINAFNRVKNSIQSIGSSIIRVINDPLRRTIGLASSLGQSFTNFGRDLRQFGKDATATGGVATFLQSQALGTVSSLKTVMNEIRVFGNLTQESLKGVEQVVLDFSAATKFGPAESADAFLGLQKAGLDVATSIEVLGSVGELATAGNYSLEQSTNAVVRAMNIYGIAADETARITDGYVQAANNSTAEVSDLAAGMNDAATIAEQFGLGFEETVAILAMFTDAGISGDQAGTQLRSMLTNMLRPTEQVGEALADLDVSLTDAQGNIRPLNDIMSDFNRSMTQAREVTVQVTRGLNASQRDIFEEAQSAYERASRTLFLNNAGLAQSSDAVIKRNQEIAGNAERIMREMSSGSDEVISEYTTTLQRTQEQNLRSIQAIAGSFGQVGFSVLLAEGEDGINNFVEEMGKLPTAATLAEEKMKTFEGTIESLRGSLDVLRYKALSPLIDKVLNPLGQAAITVVNQLSSLPSSLLAAVGGVSLFAAVATTLVGVLSLLTGIVIGGLGLGLTALSGVLSTVAFFLFNPVGLIAGFVGLSVVMGGIVALGSAVVAGLGAIGYVAKDTLNAIRNNTEGFADTLTRIKDNLLLVVNGVKELFGSVIDFVTGTGDAVDSVSAKTPILMGIVNTVDELVGKLVGYVEQAKLFFEGLNTFRDFVSFDEGSITANAEEELQRVRMQLKLLKEDGQEVFSSKSYTVSGGDTLWGIAQQYASDVGISVQDALQQIRDLNTNLEGDFITVGQEIVLPGITTEESDISADVAALEEREAALELQTMSTEDLIKRQKQLNRIISNSDEPWYSKDAVQNKKELDDINALLEERTHHITQWEKIQQKIQGSELMKTLFGEEATSGESLQRVFTAFESRMKSIRNELPQLGAGIRAIFTDGFSAGLPMINDSINNIGIQIINMFRQVFGGGALFEWLNTFFHTETWGAKFQMVLGALGSAFRAFIGAVGPPLLNAAIKLITGAIRALPGVFSALAVAILGEDSGIITTVNSIVEDIKTAFTDITESEAFKNITSALETFVDTLEPHIDAIGEGLRYMFDQIKNSEPAMVGVAVVGGLLLLVLTPLGGILASIAAGLALFTIGLRIVSNTIQPFTDLVVNLFEGINNIAQGDFSAALENIKAIGEAVGGIFSGIAEGFLEGTVDIVQLIFDALGVDIDIETRLQELADVTDTLLTAIGDKITEKLNEWGITDIVANVGTTLWGIFKDGFQNVKDTYLTPENFTIVKDILKNLISGGVDLLKNSIGDVLVLAVAVKNALQTVVSSALANFSVSDINAENIKNGFFDIITAGIDLLKDIDLSVVSDTLSDILGGISLEGIDIIGSLEGILDFFNIENLPDPSELVQPFIDLIKDAVSLITDAFSPNGVIGTAISGLGSAFNAAKDLAGGAWGAVSGIFGGGGSSDGEDSEPTTPAPDISTLQPDAISLNLILSPETQERIKGLGLEFVTLLGQGIQSVDAMTSLETTLDQLYTLMDETFTRVFRVEDGVASGLGFDWGVKIAQGIIDGLTSQKDNIAALLQEIGGMNVASREEGPAMGPGRQHGGPVDGGRTYPVNESGIGELYQTRSGAQYFLPARDGRIHPLKQVDRRPSNNYTDQSMVFSPNIQIDGSGGVTYDQVQDIVQRVANDFKDTYQKKHTRMDLLTRGN